MEQGQSGAAQAQLIVVTRQVADFEKHFSSALNKTVFVFSEVGKAFETWRQLASTKPPHVAADFAALSDGESGFRLSKAIRLAEAEAGATEPCRIFLMGENPTPVDEVWARKSGAMGVIKKQPESLLKVFQIDGGVSSKNNAIPAASAPTRKERRLRQPNGIRKPFSPVLRRRMEYWNLVLRRFIGSAATKVSTDAYRMMSDGAIAMTEDAYTEYLALRVPSAEMREGFLREVNLAFKR